MNHTDIAFSCSDDRKLKVTMIVLLVTVCT